LAPAGSWSARPKEPALLELRCGSKGVFGDVGDFGLEEVSQSRTFIQRATNEAVYFLDRKITEALRIIGRIVKNITLGLFIQPRMVACYYTAFPILALS
jgi:hypothetical protein